MSPAKIAALRLAATYGSVIVAAPAAGDDPRPNVIAGNTFAALAKAGLLTHDTNGRPEPSFYAWVGGAEVYITSAGRAALL